MLAPLAMPESFPRAGAQDPNRRQAPGQGAVKKKGGPKDRPFFVCQLQSLIL